MKKGISLITLIATLVVMAILLTTITISGISAMNDAKKMTLASELSLLQESVNSYMARSNGQFPISDSILLDISQVTASSRPQFDSETVNNNKIVLYKVDYKVLGISALKYGYQGEGTSDIYVMSKDTKKIYYAKGVAVGNKTYYTLTDELKELIQYRTAGTLPLTKDGIEFRSSNVNWTKENVAVEVKIPIQYVSKTVTVKGSNITKSTSDATYDTYLVSGIDGNYTIEVSYAVSMDASMLSQTYHVNNVDKVAPILELDKNKQILLDSLVKEEVYAYFNITKKQDILSGVSVVKYENEKIDADQIASYFKANGKTSYKEIIPIMPGVREITVYIEDKAGNWTADVVTVQEDIYIRLLALTKQGVTE